MVEASILRHMLPGYLAYTIEPGKKDRYLVKRER